MQGHAMRGFGRVFGRKADQPVAAEWPAGARPPPGTDWAWRPALWSRPLGPVETADRSRLGGEATLFHDGRAEEVTLRQIAGSGPVQAVQIGFADFGGSFFSLALDLPGAAACGLSRRHILRADLEVTVDRPLRLFLRLNIQHGPDLEQMLREVPLDAAPGPVEFDLFYARINEKRVERLWLDLILERPAMTRVTLGDLTLARHPRAGL